MFRNAVFSAATNKTHLVQKKERKKKKKKRQNKMDQCVKFFITILVSVLWIKSKNYKYTKTTQKQHKKTTKRDRKTA